MDPAPRQPSLFSQITVQHGPAGLLGRVFLKCEALCHELGITLEFATLNDLVDVNRANRDSWAPLWSGFDPSFSLLTPANSFCILGRDRQARVVVTQAARFLDWPLTNYRDEAESLRLMYAHPGTQKQPGERCEVSALAAKGITGRIVYSGAAWCHPDYRGKRLTELLPRFSRSLAYTRWESDCTVTMMAEPVVRGGVLQRSGHKNIEWEIRMFNSRGLIPRFALLWTKRAEMLDDLQEFLGGAAVSREAVRRVANA